MDYVSIDLETTGLNPYKCSILEFGAIIDDLNESRAIDKLPRFHTYIVNDNYTGSPYALAMNHKILSKIAGLKKESLRCLDNYSLSGGRIIENGEQYMKLEMLPIYFAKFLEDEGYLKENGLIHFVAAGKNFAGFDLQFLEKIPAWNDKIRVSHRVFDPGSMYFKMGDEEIPDTKVCMKRAGLKSEVAHNAIDDAKDVIRLIRYKVWGMILENGKQDSSVV